MSYLLVMASVYFQNLANSGRLVITHATARTMKYATSTTGAVLPAVMMATWWTPGISGTPVPGMDMGVR